MVTDVYMAVPWLVEWDGEEEREDSRSPHVARLAMWLAQ